MRQAILGLLVLFCGCTQPSGESINNMTLIEGGAFRMGTNEEELDSILNKHSFPRGYIASEYPSHHVSLSSFYMDQFEVTNGEFKDFVLKNPMWQKENLPDSLHNGKYLEHWDDNEYPVGTDEYPVYNITWHAAMKYCECLGKRLPTEAEWEYVASNLGDTRWYPWGNTPPDSSKVNFMNIIGKAISVGSYPPNELGIYDLAGNVWEFMLDAWSDDYYQHSPAKNPVNGSKTYEDEDLWIIDSRRVIRGGSWGGAGINLRVSFRDSHPPKGADDHVGFRCVMDRRQETDIGSQNSCILSAPAIK